MVTVVFGDVKIRYLDEWPTGVTDAIVTALCATAETRVQSRVGADGTFPLTSDAGVEMSVDAVVQMIEYAKWAHAGGAQTGLPPPPLFTREMLDRIQIILQDTDMIDLIDTYDPDVD